MKKAAILFFTLAIIVGCAVNIKTINQSKNLDTSKADSTLETYANKYFWDNFHRGNYDNIDSTLYYLTAAYNENPNHLETITHLGFTHMWALSERYKLGVISPTILDHSTLALKYFGESYRLNPNDPRVLGFVADLKMAVGDISDDEKLSKQGYFEGKKSIRQWSEFNYFTVGYILSKLHQDTWQYEKGLEWQWKTIDECYCEKFDRDNPDIKKYLPLEKTETNLKRKRACWNTWIAPHNVEGFYLNMGDMLVKKGDWEKATEIYQLAKQVPQYENWVFKDVLERRIKNVKENIAKFRMEINSKKIYSVDDVILINSPIACLACHKMNEKELALYDGFDWEDYKEKNNVYFLKK